MSTYLLTGVAVVYLVCAFIDLPKNPPLAVVFFSFFLSNCALAWLAYVAE